MVPNQAITLNLLSLIKEFLENGSLKASNSQRVAVAMKWHNRMRWVNRGMGALGRKSKKVKKIKPIKFEWHAEDDQLFRKAVAEIPEQSIPHKDHGPDKTAPKQRKPPKPLVIDLHGLTLLEAQQFVRNKISQELKASDVARTFKIITGKGLHSSGQGVLAQEIHGYVSRHFSGRITSMESSPNEVAVFGMPVRGHFMVTIRP
jgi:DNA-nicking Smr family endonuclease